MLISILIDIQYWQKAIFNFEKGSNRQNYCSSGSLHPLKKSPPIKIFVSHLTGGGGADSPPPLPPTPIPYRYLENPDLIPSLSFLSLNISDFSFYFLCKNCNPPPITPKKPPSLSQQPPLKIEILYVKTPISENLVGGSMPPLPSRKGEKGAHYGNPLINWVCINLKFP